MIRAPVRTMSPARSTPTAESVDICASVAPSVVPPMWSKPTVLSAVAISSGSEAKSNRSPPLVAITPRVSISAATTTVEPRSLCVPPAASKLPRTVAFSAAVTEIRPPDPAMLLARIFWLASRLAVFSVNRMTDPLSPAAPGAAWTLMVDDTVSASRASAATTPPVDLRCAVMLPRNCISPAESNRITPPSVEMPAACGTPRALTVGFSRAPAAPDESSTTEISPFNNIRAPDRKARRRALICPMTSMVPVGLRSSVPANRVAVALTFVPSA